MPRSMTLLLALATLSAGAHAQSANPAGAGMSSSFNQSQAAPIVRNPAGASTRQISSSQPIPGVWLRSDPTSSVKTVSADGNGTEIRVERGRANVQVAHPADHAEILVDLPGGQTSLVKDGLYTFNADTNTVRVLRGEADAYVGVTDANAKPIKVKEDHQFSLVAGTKPVEVDPRQMTADLLPGGAPGRGFGEARAVGYGPYGDGFYEGYPYPAYPYMAYGWGYPWGFGYPYGFGYYGGFRGGFRGGFGRR